MATLSQAAETPLPAGPSLTRRHQGSSPAPDHEPANSPLCSRCRRFDIHSFAPPIRTRSYRLRDTDVSANAGCRFCGLLSRAVSGVEKPRYHNNVFFNTKGGPVERELYIHMTLSQNYEDAGKSQEGPGLAVNRMRLELGDRFSELRHTCEEEICLVAEPRSAAARNGDVSGRYLGRDPASDEIFETIERWIRDCERHPNCNRTISGALDSDPRGAPLPTRCVEIQDDGNLILRETSDSMRGPYITVTHRWTQLTGKCMTTLDNYAARLEGDGFTNIPRVFEDAIFIAKRLGVRLLWIDSICIIQSGDNSRDWTKEAPMMAQYYQYSLLTIAGTMSDTTTGILRPLPKEWTPWGRDLVQLPYRDRVGAQQGHFYIYRRQTRLENDYISAVRSTHLLSRGWVFQEWLLSKRLLWYTPRGVFLECRSEPPATPGSERMCLRVVPPELRAHLEMRLLLHFSNARILEFWYRALETYSGCELTRPREDRIIALAGLAKEVREVLHSRRSRAGMGEKEVMYLAGLWLDDIRHGILWEMDGRPTNPVHEIDAAASWSWAHLQVSVKWPGRDERADLVAKVRGFSFTRRKRYEQPEHLFLPRVALPDFDPRNMFASLHLTGRVYPVHVRGYLTTTEELELAAQSTAYPAIPSASSCNWRAICSPTAPEVIAGWGSLEGLPQEQEGGPCADFGVAVHAFHVSTRYVRTGWLIRRFDPVLDVLFLQEVSGADGYQRLGVGRIADPDLISDILAVDEEDIQLL